jgi:hypothetical protein
MPFLGVGTRDPIQSFEWASDFSGKKNRFLTPKILEKYWTNVLFSVKLDSSFLF